MTRINCFVDTCYITFHADFFVCKILSMWQFSASMTTQHIANDDAVPRPITLSTSTLIQWAAYQWPTISVQSLLVMPKCFILGTISWCCQKSTQNVTYWQSQNSSSKKFPLRYAKRNHLGDPLLALPKCIPKGNISAFPMPHQKVIFC